MTSTRDRMYELASSQEARVRNVCEDTILPTIRSAAFDGNYQYEFDAELYSESLRSLLVDTHQFTVTKNTYSFIVDWSSKNKNLQKE